MFNRDIRKYFGDKREKKKHSAIYRHYHDHTMVTEDDFTTCLSLIDQFRDIEGCVIECGVWRGGMIAGIAELLGKKRNYFLFDSFEGLPPAKEIDGESAIKWQKDVNSPGYYDNCRAEMKWAEEAMKKSGAENFRLVKGWFDKTIPVFELNEPIAILRLDGDWYDSTMVCLEHFFPHVAEGGLIILDDYYVWDGCSRALHDYLSAHKRGERIHDAYSSGCYLVKKSDGDARKL
ncbi:MAG TPA: TylF/MycF/NovP-related O-methyltransferase [Bacteroidia bacterium]|jgi:O-methyltransferase|nr:TylF/MycF/NovP-related O-methyltransferase [Bacteroidia bacterium]